MNGPTDAFGILVYFAKLSLLAVGGANATVSQMHRDIVGAGLLTDAAFAEGWALAAAAPGPNVLFVVVLGWSFAGWAGLVGALVGFLGPALVLTWFVAGIAGRLHHNPVMAALRAGLVPIAIGLSMATGLVTAGAAARGTAGEMATALAITAGAVLFMWYSPRSPVWALAGGGVLGLLLLR